LFTFLDSLTLGQRNNGLKEQFWVIYLLYAL